MSDTGDPIVDGLNAIQAEIKQLKAGNTGAGKPADPLHKSLDGFTKRLDSLESIIRNAGLGDLGQNLRGVTQELRTALPAARRAKELGEGRPWLLWCLIAVAALLGLLAAFVGGVVYTRSGLVMTSEVGCHYLGGQWSPKQDGSGSVCWR